MQQGERALAAHHGVGLPSPARQARRPRLEAAAREGSFIQAAILKRGRPSRHRVMSGGTVHIVGAGLAGLAAAVGLVGTGREIVVHELARHAGGRCRSYFEPALGLTIDNGNHLLLSANENALSFLRNIGSEGKLAGPSEAKFAFADLASDEHWVLHPNEGPIPWWIFAERRRVPGTEPLDYLPIIRLLRPGRDQSLDKVIDCSGMLYQRLSRPLFLAALNTEPSEASAHLAGAILRKTLV